MIRVLGPGDFFGELSVIAPAPRNATIACLDATETLGLHREAFDELRGKHPGVDAVLMHALIAEVRRLSVQLSQALYLPAESRVWRRVADLTRLYETTSSDTITIPLTQEDVAHMAGTTRPTANKVLRCRRGEGRASHQSRLH